MKWVKTSSRHAHRSGTVESRIRQLVMKLEYVDTLLLAHPFVKSFDRTNYCLNEEEQRAVSIGEVPVEVEKRTEKDLKDGEGGTVYTTTFYIGLQIERRPGACLLFRVIVYSKLALAFASCKTSARRVVGQRPRPVD
jgi:poly(A) polymerase Pap1